MRTTARLAALLLLLGATTGCISVMKKEAFEGPMVHTGDQLNKARADYDAKSKLYQAVAAKTSTPQAVPYPELGRLLGQMRAAIEPLAKIRERMYSMEKEFTDLRQGRPDISSDRPQWTPFMKLYEEMQGMVPKVNAQLDAYSGLTNKFAELCNNYNVRHLDVAEIRGKLKGNLDAVDKAVGEIRGQVAAMRQKLKERAAATLGLDRQKERNGILDRVQALGDQLETAAAGLKGKAGAFEASLAGKSELWSGPGFPKLEIFDQVAKGMEQINALGQQLNAETAKWNDLNK